MKKAKKKIEFSKILAIICIVLIILFALYKLLGVDKTGNWLLWGVTAAEKRVRHRNR